MLQQPQPLTAVRSRAGRPDGIACPGALSPSERAIVLGLAAGRAPKQLAADNAVALATVRCHIQSAKRKTRARTLAELVAITTRLGGPVSH